MLCWKQKILHALLPHTPLQWLTGMMGSQFFLPCITVERALGKATQHSPNAAGENGPLGTENGRQHNGMSWH